MADRIEDGGRVVRALEWVGEEAQTAFGKYTIKDVRARGLGFGLSHPNGEVKLFHDDERAARKYAQADYERRILAALVIDPARARQIGLSVGSAEHG